MTNTSQERHKENTQWRRLDKPVIGVIATEANSALITRTILRAREHGHSVLVTHHGDPDIEAVQYADQLNAEVVHPNSTETDDQLLWETLTKVARINGFPGILYYNGNSKYIDFEASTTALKNIEKYGTVAETESVVSQPEASRIMVVIPAYNEEKTIRDVVQKVPEYASIVVIDDGSEDDTAILARDTGATVIQHKRNKGYGAALKAAFREAQKNDISNLVVVDGDGQHDPRDINRLLQVQKESNAEIIIGSRFVDGAQSQMPMYRRIGLWIVNALTNLSFGAIRRNSWIRDTQSGFRVYDRDAIESLATDKTIGDQMTASTDILYHAHYYGYEVKEVGVEMDYNVVNGSTLNPISHGLSLVNNILKMVERKRPVTVLGIPGFLTILLGLGFSYWTLSNFLQTSTFPLGLALVSAFLLLAGIFACFTAIILHSLNTYLSLQNIGQK